jgi:hypothetical protein
LRTGRLSTIRNGDRQGKLLRIDPDEVVRSRVSIFVEQDLNVPQMSSSEPSECVAIRRRFPNEPPPFFATTADIDSHYPSLQYRTAYRPHFISDPILDMIVLWLQVRLKSIAGDAQFFHPELPRP